MKASEYTSEFGEIQYKDTRDIRRQSRSLSEERLSFRDGERLGTFLLESKAVRRSARYAASSRSGSARTTGITGGPAGKLHATGTT